MSGIGGFVNSGPIPADPRVLEAIRGALTPRGPDRQQVHTVGRVGLVQSTLETCAWSRAERLPLSFEGQAWIVADARIDNRQELVSELISQGRNVALSAGDGELILHAYHVWGTASAARLIGDFAFAIWDEQRQQLFCARDQFGVRPFFYSQRPDAFVFGSNIRAVRQHPAVRADLDDDAVADFLLFGHFTKPQSAIFADIRRLAPAHWLLFNADGLQIQRYRNLEPGTALRYRREADYVDHFRELLRQAVADRLRGEPVAISMSGGLDSTIIAALACQLLRDSQVVDPVRAYSVTYDRTLPDEEGHFARLAAQHLGIPLRIFQGEDHPLLGGWEEWQPRLNEPGIDINVGTSLEFQRESASHSRVALSGAGGDELLRWSPLYFPMLLRSGRWWQYGRDIGRYLVAHRWLPPLGIKSGWRRLRHGRQEGPLPLPDWLNPDFVRDLDLAARWGDSWSPRTRGIRQHDEAIWYLNSIYLTNCVEGHDCEWGDVAQEYRFPLLDRRLVDFVLRVPAVMWFPRKRILRRAAEGLLPDEVRRRKKTPLAGDPLTVHGATIRIPEVNRSPSTLYCRYVDPQRVGGLGARVATGDQDTLYARLNAVALGLWLRS